MAAKEFDLDLDLYLDESGSFDPGDFSFVGGLLIASDRKKDAKALVKNNEIIHASEFYDKEDYPRRLDKLKELGGQFVIFENPINRVPLGDDFVYLNILAEGIAKLMRRLSQENPNQKVRLNITAATRKAGEKQSGIIPHNPYIDRIDEKIYYAMRREKVPNVKEMSSVKKVSDAGYSFVFNAGYSFVLNVEYSFTRRDARKDKQLMLADLICYTYRRTRNDNDTFFKDVTKRKAIKNLYEPGHIYTVLEDADTQYLESQIAARNYGEAMFRLCAMKQLNEHKKTKDRLVNEIARSNPFEQEAWFSNMSLRIGQLNRSREFDEGIRLAKQYKSRFLRQFAKHDSLKDLVNFWTFDTDFYLATMYDHVGNIAECRKSLQECDSNINSIIRSWEHLDYYYRYRIRKLNALMNDYAFNKVLDDSKQLEKILTDTTELFNAIDTYENQEAPIHSEMLGRVCGIQLMAYVNLLRNHPEYLDVAIKVSNKALEQFDQEQDLSRQHQYRCLLHAEAGQGSKALQHLLASQGMELSAGCFSTLVDKAFESTPSGNAFLMWHYTNTMFALQSAGDKRAGEMAKELTNHAKFKEAFSNELITGHPWNLALWNISRYLREEGDGDKAKGYYRRALALTQANSAKTTMETLGISMQADWLLWARKNTEACNGQKALKEAEDSFAKLMKRIAKLPLTDEMNKAFGIAELSKSNVANISDNALKKAAQAFLR